MDKFCDKVKGKGSTKYSGRNLQPEELPIGHIS